MPTQPVTWCRGVVPAALLRGLAHGWELNTAEHTLAAVAPLPLRARP